jgi:hypothetical protein
VANSIPALMKARGTEDGSMHIRSQGEFDGCENDEVGAQNPAPNRGQTARLDNQTKQRTTPLVPDLDSMLFVVVPVPACPVIVPKHTTMVDGRWHHVSQRKNLLTLSGLVRRRSKYNKGPCVS